MARRNTIVLALFASAMMGLAACAKAPEEAFVAAANPYAVRAGAEVLAAGGSALDAGIAVQTVLTLVEPQSSGLGGGAFLLYWDSAREKLFAYDGRETAPASAKADLFLTPSGEAMDFFQAVIGGRSVGAPGLVALLAEAHRAHGVLPWADLFKPAERLAGQGFRLSPRLHAMLARDPVLPSVPPARALFYQPSGAPHAVGALIKNPALAESFALLAAQGSDVFYSGALGQKIVAAVRNAPRNPGLLSLTDLASYQARARQPLCRPYRRYTVCGMPPPSSGGVGVLQILGILQHFDLAALAPESFAAVHLISEASRLAYADRARYLADDDFVPVPLDSLLAPDYLARRAALIDPERALAQPQAGDFAGAREAGRDRPLPSTTHFTIRDHEGNIASMTSSIEAPFGSHMMVGGFFLNNQLTDFAFAPADAANAPAGGKRPLSSMAPVIIFDQTGAPVAALGSPGGKRIIAYVALTIIALLDWQMPVADAIALARHVAIDAVELEEGSALTTLAPELERAGHKVKSVRLTSGLHGLSRLHGFWRGGADPRREGEVIAVPRRP